MENKVELERIIKKAYEDGMLRTHLSSADYYSDLYANGAKVMVTYNDIIEKCGWKSFCKECGVDENYNSIYETSSDETFLISLKSAKKLKLVDYSI